MGSRQRIIVTVRWIQWLLSAFSFGVCIAYFLTNVNFYLWISSTFRAQVGLAGFIHVYLYLAAIWVSVKPQGFLVWALFDILFGLLAAAAIGTSEPSISEYCSKSSLTLYWSDTNFAYVPLDHRSSSDVSTLTNVFDSIYLTKACGMNAGVAVANGLLIFLFALTAFLQIRQHRDQQEGRIHNLSQPERPQEQFEGGWRQSLPSGPFTRQKVNLEV